ncbi:hypothetical protein MPER_11599, partial [Moniliophthora perniciosa FA553]
MTSRQPALNQHDGAPNGVPGEKQKAHADLSKLADPLPRLWRGDEEGKISYPSIPTFEDKYEEREWLKGHLAAAFRYWGKLGFNEVGIAGHITLRDSVLKDHYWMNPFGKHYSMIKKSDLVLVGPDGRPTPE